MTSSWDRFKGVSLPEGTTVPPRGTPWFPSTYLPVTDRPGIRQPPIFDPALKQFDRAFRAGEPIFDDPEVERRWRRARRRAIDHLVRVVAESPWNENLVLRGSLLLEAWVGEEAREPGDLDWVVVPPTVNMDSPLTVAMFKGVIAAAVAGPADGRVTFDPGDIATDEIWTYDRVPGRRLVFTWRAGELPPGTVQLDFTFNERLPVPPEVALIPRTGGGEPTPILAASPELSLAWKLLWLASDGYPQGKDLYDAVLLAERVALPRDLLHGVLRDALGEREAGEFGPETIRSLDEVDWDEFRAEYPHVTGNACDWLERLARALGPAFAEE
ncbi:nucleotidyl transferase AbiEii/AbiGii toxin family protein [Microbispora sp. H10830]|uniref:nucleotidyl transferase AbiEii/AbiGii toxin family protein n=1 Tax=Microbispora sp. H10830 TaxID=2729109 RepID=UPI001602816C|nr:nucleotidyl transferase AbiEii/AbiGii toxin family protein [Microbispora sp. H10830]